MVRNTKASQNHFLGLQVVHTGYQGKPDRTLNLLCWKKAPVAEK